MAWKASDCCERIITASMKPRRSIRMPNSMYMTPSRLWSTLVIHSAQR